LLPDIFQYAKSTGIPLLFTDLLNINRNHVLIDNSENQRNGPVDIHLGIRLLRDDFIENFTAFKIKLMN